MHMGRAIPRGIKYRPAEDSLSSPPYSARTAHTAQSDHGRSQGTPGGDEDGGRETAGAEEGRGLGGGAGSSGGGVPTLILVLELFKLRHCRATACLQLSSAVASIALLASSP